jgi:hypothetical protein
MPFPAVKKAASYPGMRGTTPCWFVTPAGLRNQCGLPRGKSKSRACARRRKLSRSAFI